MSWLLMINIAFPVSASHGTSSWKTTPVPGCPMASPTFLIQPTPSTTCTYLGWLYTSLAGTSVSMPQVTGNGDHLQRKCTLWTCVPECCCEPLQCAIQPSFELIEWLFGSVWTGWVVCDISYAVVLYYITYLCEFEQDVAAQYNCSNHGDKPGRVYTLAHVQH